MTTSLDRALDMSQGRPKGCLVCGEKAAAAVTVRIQELGSGGSIDKARRSVSVMRSLCADHAVELYTRLSDSLKGASDAG